MTVSDTSGEGTGPEPHMAVPDAAPAATAAPAEPERRMDRRERREIERQRLRRQRAWIRGAAAVVLGAMGVGSFWFGWTIAETRASLPGAPIPVIGATWARDHGLTWLVVPAEEAYYALFKRAPEGGEPTISARVDDEEPAPTASPQATDGGSAAPQPTSSPAPTRQHLSPPPTMVSPAKSPVEDEGVWQPIGTRVDGIPALYVTRVRPNAENTSVFTTLMWVDTSLVDYVFVPGTEEPGGPNPFNGALPEELRPNLLANWNGGFRLKDSKGGYYYDGTTVAELVDGAASAVFYRDGSMRIGEWGRDLKMSKDVLAVRQVLDLIVSNGKSQAEAGDLFWRWGGPSVKEATMTWRTAVGELADGSIIYATGPYLSGEDLAKTLVNAGVVNAMVLDMNDWFAAGYYFKHPPGEKLQCKPLDPNMDPNCTRYVYGFARDSFQVIGVPSAS